MFSKVITESDAFLELPLSTQALYFHLSMQGDDDGFINGPKKIMRMIGASQNEYDLLIAKNFILEFEDGIVLVKHWLMHNYLRKDRYKPTVYTKQKEMLFIKSNKAYTLDGNQGLPIGIPTVDVDKSSIDKNSLNQISLDKVSQEEIKAIVNHYQQNISGNMPQVVVQSLCEWLNTFNSEMIIEAITITAKKQANYKYTEGILNNWQQKGFTSIVDVQNETKTKGSGNPFLDALESGDY